MSTEDMGGGIIGDGLSELLDSSQKMYVEKCKEIRRLENRLEVYDSTGKIRLSEDCDGIACRDETIRLLDERHEGDKKVVHAAEACARKHQERAEALSADVETKELARKAALKTVDSLTASKAALFAENKALHEQVAALESKEVCAKPHDDHVIEGCPYCRLEDIMTLANEYIDSYERLAYPLPVSLR